MYGPKHIIMSQVFWNDDEQLQEWQKEILKREIYEQRKRNTKGWPGGNRSFNPEE